MCDCSSCSSFISRNCPCAVRLYPRTGVVFAFENRKANIVGINTDILTQNERSLDRVLQFANIAGPMMIGELAHRRRGELFDRHARLLRKLAEEEAGENGDVGFPVAERIDHHLHDL